MRLKIRSPLGYLALALSLASLCTVLPAAAQVPDTFTNLKVLPKESSKAELISTMRSWTQALGVRCVHCHVGPDNLQGADFASDQKPAKLAAREMLKMVQAINTQFLTALPAHDGPRQAVGCYTCHHGQEDPPAELGGTLIELANTQGPGAALARFRDLKAKDLAAGIYDFRERTLIRVGIALVEGGKLAGAIELLQGASELFPASANVFAALAQAQMQKGDREAALGSVRKALALDPGSDFAKGILAHLESAGETPKP